MVHNEYNNIYIYAIWSKIQVFSSSAFFTSNHQQYFGNKLKNFYELHLKCFQRYKIGLVTLHKMACSVKKVLLKNTKHIRVCYTFDFNSKFVRRTCQKLSLVRNMLADSSEKQKERISSLALTFVN